MSVLSKRGVQSFFHIGASYTLHIKCHWGAWEICQRNTLTLFLGNTSPYVMNLENNPEDPLCHSLKFRPSIMAEQIIFQSLSSGPHCFSSSAHTVRGMWSFRVDKIIKIPSKASVFPGVEYLYHVFRGPFLPQPN